MIKAKLTSLSKRLDLTLLYSLTCLFGFSLSVTFLPSILPKPTYIFTGLLFLSLIRLGSSGYINLALGKIVPDNIKVTLFLFFTLTMVYICDFITLLLEGNSLPTSPIASSIFLFSIPIFLNSFNIRKYNQYLKVYAFFALTLALLGVWSFFLSNYFYLNTPHWTFNLYDLTSHRFDKDLHFKGLYSFPYFTGAVLTGGSPFSVMGLNFFRVSSFTPEPWYAATITAPAIFLFAKKNLIFSKALSRGLAIIILVAFQFFAVSITSIIALILTLLATVISLSRIDTHKKLLWLGLGVSLFILTFVSLFFVNEVYDLRSSGFSILSKFRYDSEPIQLFLAFLIRPFKNLYLLIYTDQSLRPLQTFETFKDLFVWLQIFTLFGFSLFRIYKKDYWISGSIVCFYSLCILRGTASAAVFWPFHIIMLTLLIWPPGSGYEKISKSSVT